MCSGQYICQAAEDPTLANVACKSMNSSRYKQAERYAGPKSGWINKGEVLPVEEGHSTRTFPDAKACRGSLVLGELQEEIRSAGWARAVPSRLYRPSLHLPRQSTSAKMGGGMVFMSRGNCLDLAPLGSKTRPAGTSMIELSRNH